ncbi:MAG: hypothetical protein QMD94_02765 [Candidatus Omnitrophota bacterium]|nr:hypothetical protein [Candidatus Omnitrophota bacterium]
MILVIGVLLLAVTATMLIGEAGFSRLRLVNVADSALVSSASSFCRDINSIRFIKKKMHLRYVELQAKTLFTPYVTWWDGLKDLYSVNNLFGILGSYRLYKQAKDSADNAVKDLRKSLYRSCLGTDLIDEPKLYLPSEVIWNDEQKKDRIIDLDLDAYSKRDSHFQKLYRDLTNSDTWQGNDLISYSFNKTKKEVINFSGIFTFGEPDNNNNKYESYLKVEVNVPVKVKIKVKPRFIFFLWWGKGYPLPGFGIHPCAEIDIKVKNGNAGISLSVEKKSSFKNVPFFGREIVLKHENKARITGGGSRIFDFKVMKK